jgi:ABC-type branched-subunit amino acid transport system ATPase component
MSDVILEVQHLHKRFGGLHVLSDVNIEVPRGAVFGVIGPNGAGKTTLVDILSGLQRPTSGSVVLNGMDLTKQSAHTRAVHGIGRTFQIPRIFTDLSVRENMQVPLFSRRRGHQGIDMTMDDIVERLEIGPLMDRRGAVLTLPERRRVEIGRALVMRPSVLLLDEALSGFHSDAATALIRLIDSLTDSGLTVLLIEHVLDIVVNWCQTVVVLDQGEVISSGLPADVMKDPRVVESYVGRQI